MSDRTGPSRDRRAAGHSRARELSAWAVDEPLGRADAAWLVGHLAQCESCRGIAAEYDEQQALLRRLWAATPIPPRDLWARTAASIEADATRRERWFGRLAGPRHMPLAPLAGLLVVAVAVGAGLLNGGPLFPRQDGAHAPAPTPIAMTSGMFQFLTRGADGALELSTSRYDAVCPVGAQDCGTSAASNTTQLSTGLGDLGRFDAVISPTQDRIVVMGTTSTSGGVYVVPVNVAPAASPTPAPIDTSNPVAATATPATVSERPSQPVVDATRTPTPTATPSPTPATLTPSPSVGPSERPSRDPGATASPAGTADASVVPSPTASVEVSPAPDGALEIASGVVVVGSASAYSPDGTQFAFTARPADGSAGPTCTCGRPPRHWPARSRSTTDRCLPVGSAISCL